MTTASSQAAVDCAAAGGIPRKRRAVVFGGGIGMFPPLMERFREEFDIVAAPVVRLPALYLLWYRLISIRWPRNAWYRTWRYHVEKTPAVFRRLTRLSARALAPLEGQYDVILFLGAMFSPGVKGKTIFVFTDSCRWHSSRNIHDEVSHFHSARDEVEWLDLEGEVYRSAARVFSGSEFVSKALVEHYGVEPAKAVVSGFGAGLGFGQPYEKSFDGKTILYIGKGDFEKKGGTLLMQAFETVRKTLPEAELHVVGQENLRGAPGVVDHGFVRDRKQLVELMRSAHVFALPSLVDRNPISVLEAMATSTPCITSDYGAMPELVEDAGLVTACNDVDGLSRALLTLLRDPQLARAMGNRGRLRFEQTYNWDSIWKVIETEMRAALR
ncbi:MAG: glycosyltransferase family 4 protein [Mycobacteriales bacterium]